MTSSFPLQSLYECSSPVLDSSCLKEQIQALLAGHSISLDSLLEISSLWKSTWIESDVMSNWKMLLTLALMNHLSRAHPYPDLLTKLHFFLNQPWNQQSQYLRVLVALCHVLLQLPVPLVDPHLLDGGAAPIDLQEYCPWRALPYQPYHTEFATFLCLLAFLTQKEELKKAIHKIANWQCKAIDAHFLPFSGLFVQERDGSFFSYLAWNYVFFQGAFRLTGERHFSEVAYAQRKHLLEQKVPYHMLNLSPLLPLMENIFGIESQNELLMTSHSLSESIYDPATCLVGYRLPRFHAICTLHGGYTGLGCFKYEDIEIVNYGPQYLPLDNCQGFGIEGNYLSDQGIRKPSIEWEKGTFCLRGCTRLVDQPYPSSDSFQLGKFRGLWLEIEQQLQNQQLDIKTSFLGFSGWEDVAFSFFVKAKRCQIDDMVLDPCSFQRYEGQTRAVALIGKNISLQLQAYHSYGSLQVIPLGGGNNFWGADFLIAYLLDSQQRSYHWKIGL